LTKAPWQIDLTNETEGLKQIDTPYGVFPFIVSKVTSLVEADINIQDKLFSSVGATDAEAEFFFRRNVSNVTNLGHPAIVRLQLMIGP